MSQEDQITGRCLTRRFFGLVGALVMRGFYGLASSITRNKGVAKMGFKQMLRIRDLQHENDQLREYVAEMEEILRKNNMHLLSRRCWCKPEVDGGHVNQGS